MANEQATSSSNVYLIRFIGSATELKLDKSEFKNAPTDFLYFTPDLTLPVSKHRTRL